MKKNVNVKIIIIILFVLCLIVQVYSFEKIQYPIYVDNADNQSVVEINSQNKITQHIKRPIKRIIGISINIPTFERKVLNGNLKIKVYNREDCIADKEIPINGIVDGESIIIPFTHSKGNYGDDLRIDIEADSKEGESIGLWINKANSNLYSDVYVNGEKSGNSTIRMSFLYKNIKLNNIWKIFFIIVIMIALSKASIRNSIYNYFSYRRLCYIGLFCIAFIVFSLRGGIFSCSMIYGEDGSYLSNIINDGFFKSCIMTRSGQSGDFYNLASYILLEISLGLNNIFWGYDLSQLPTIINMVASIMYAFIAMCGYLVFEKVHKLLGLIAYMGLLFMPVGELGLEIFGRVLNIVFLYPILASFILIYLWRQIYICNIKRYILQAILIICGLSFPISFGVIGIWLLLGGVISIKEKKTVDFIKSNIVTIMALLIGCFLIPVMIGSQGASAGMTIKPESLIEFIFARHFIFMFVYNFYSMLNDVMTMIIFLITIFCIVIALFKEYKEIHEFGEFACFCAMGFGCIFASAFMRLPMSELFDKYQTTWPDRYYYGCNFTYFIMVLYAIYLILKNKLNVFRQIILLFFGILILNNNIFPNIDSQLKKYNSDENMQEWVDCIKYAYLNDKCKDNIYIIYTHPNPNEKVWAVQLPLEYVYMSVEN